MSEILKVLVAVTLSASMAVIGGIAAELIKRLTHPDAREKTLQRIRSMGLIRVVLDAMSSTSPAHHKAA